MLQRHPEIDRHPFDNRLRMMATVHRADDGLLIAVKGAPEAILERATHVAVDGACVALDDPLREVWARRVADMAQAGLRVLAFAQRTSREGPSARDVYRDLVFLGLAGSARSPAP